MKHRSKKAKNKIDNSYKKQGLIFSRYIILLAISAIFYFTTWIYDFLLILTIYPVNFLLNLSYKTFVIGNNISIQGLGTLIQIIPACVAVSAYFLLLILNLTTSMSVKKRIHSLIFSSLALLLVNILRIYILSLMFLNNAASFEIVHKLFWYVLSIGFVVVIWFLTTYLFKIKKIPAYSDVSLLLKSIKK